MKEKAAVGSPFFVAFPSNRIPKATKDVNVLFFSSNSCQVRQGIQVNYTCEFREIFEATMLCVREMKTQKH